MVVGFVSASISVSGSSWVRASNSSIAPRLAAPIKSSRCRLATTITASTLDLPTYDPKAIETIISHRDIAKPMIYLNDLTEFKQILSFAASGDIGQTAYPKLVVVCFKAVWCKSCQAMEPKLLRLCREFYDDALFFHCDIDVMQDKPLIKGMGVDTLPFYKFYSEGMMVESFAAGVKKVEMFVERLNHYTSRTVDSKVYADAQ